MSKNRNASSHHRHGSATTKPGKLVIARSGYPVTEKMRWRTPHTLVQAIESDYGPIDLDAATDDGYSVAPRWFTAQEDCLLVQNWASGFRAFIDPKKIGSLCAADAIMDRVPAQLYSKIPEDVEAYLSSGVRIQHGLHSSLRLPVKRVFINPPWASKAIPDWIRQDHPEVEFETFPGTGRFLEKAYRESRKGLEVLCLLPQSLDSRWMKKFVVLADEVRIGRRFKFINVQGEQCGSPPGGHMLLVFRPHVPTGGWKAGPRVDWDWDPLNKQGARR